MVFHQHQFNLYPSPDPMPQHLDHTPLPQTKKRHRKNKGWSSGFKDHRKVIEADLLNTAKLKETELTSPQNKKIDESDQNTHLLKHMLALRLESSKAAKKLEGDCGYDVHPERTVKHLEDIELHSTGRSVRMPLHHASDLSRQLLESTARLRKLRDTIARTAIEKEEELTLMRRKIVDAEKDGMNRFMGVRGEKKLNKRYVKAKRKLEKINVLCAEEEFMTLKYKRMQWHLTNSLLRLQISNQRNEEEMTSVTRAETHARRKRLELYQSLAREKRSVDLIANKVSKIRNVQQIKLEEVAQCVQEQEAKFHKEKKKTIKRNRKMSLSLDLAKKKALRSMATKQFGFTSKKNAIDIQLAPLEDVFYKIKVRTGLVHLDAAAIAELYIGQNDATTILRNECSEAMIEVSGLKDKLEEKKDQLLKLKTMTKETNQHKSFYQELDIVEKDLHDRRHANEIYLTKAKKAKLNVSYICNVLKKLSNELNNLKLEDYIANEIPINMKTINASIKDKQYNYALLEIYRVVGVLANSVKGMTEDSITKALNSNKDNNASRRNSRGVTGPTEEGEEGMMTMDLTSVTRKSEEDDMSYPYLDEDSMSSPIKSARGSAAVARNAAAASLRGNMMRQQAQASGNIRVATRIATQANGYDSDLEEMLNGSMTADQVGVGAQGAWQTPRDGVSLRGGPSKNNSKGGGIRRGSRSSKNSSRAPSERDVAASVQAMSNSLFGDMEENDPNSRLAQQKKDEEEERGMKTIRQQMKQVTNMVLYRAKKLSNKHADSKKKRSKGGGEHSSGKSGMNKVHTLQLPKSPRRRSIMIDNDEDDFSRLIHSVGAGEMLGLTPHGGKMRNDGRTKQPRKPKGSRKGRGRRGSVAKRRKKKLNKLGGTGTPSKNENVIRSISSSTEF